MKIAAGLIKAEDLLETEHLPLPVVQEESHAMASLSLLDKPRHVKSIIVSIIIIIVSVWLL